MSWIDKLYAPHWAGGWTAARFLFVIVAFVTQLPRYTGIGDVYGVEDMIFRNPPFYLADLWVLTETSAGLVWGASFVGLGMLAWGGRLARPGMILWLAFSWILLTNEALNIKAYDRLLTWIAVGMLLGPIHERQLTEKYRGPYGRWFLLVVYCALYGSTGFLKAIYATDGWISGDVLAHHLVHQHFGLQPLGVWLSDKSFLVAPMAWFTVLFEAGFVFLIWFRRTNPWILLAGVALHVGIYVTMNVGPFSFVAVVAYPVLLHPETGRELYHRGQAWWMARRAQRPAEAPSA